MFQNDGGGYSASMIDFGYSSRYVDPNEGLRLPRSVPWNAPENDGRRDRCTLSQAVQADLYCFGMVCVWLLFEPLLSAATSPHHSPILVEGEVQRTAAAAATLRTRKSWLQTFAHQLLESEPMLGEHSRRALGTLFESCLSDDPRQRDAESLRDFIGRLVPHM